MDITWYGHSCFRITERGQLSVVHDPLGDGTGLEPPRLKGEIVTMSRDEAPFNNVDAVKGHQQVLPGPGEYEFGGVFIYAVAMHNLEHEDGPQYNVSHVVQYGKLSVIHLGDLAHVPEQTTLESLGEINVALVPVGDHGVLTANQAAEVIALLEPNYIVPMQYDIPGLTITRDPIEKFLKAMGVTRAQESPMLRVNTNTLPEQPQVVVLEPQS